MLIFLFIALLGTHLLGPISKVSALTATTSSTYGYIGILDTSTSRNWYEANEYCAINYHSSLAAMHSNSEESDAKSVLIDTSDAAWIGLNDIKNEAGTDATQWVWVDGSENDYTIDWDDNEPNNSGDQDCAYYFYSNSWIVDDRSCTAHSYNQFICNPEQYWRPIFKISDNLADFGGKTDSYEYWLNGTATYTTLSQEKSYITNEFDASTVDTTSNFRSLFIDYWGVLYNTLNVFDKVRISLYKDGNEVIYFRYHASKSKLNWMDVSNIIDSSYPSLIYDADYDSIDEYRLYGMQGDGPNKRNIAIMRGYGGCDKDNGWLVVAGETGHCDGTADGVSWSPAEAATIPQIRYSTNQDSNGFLTYGTFYYSSQNEIADTMVIYINGDFSNNSPEPDCISARFLDHQNPSSGWYCLSNL